MRSVLRFALLAALLPGLSAAQTTSTTIQHGEGNQATTLQSGQTDATTIQVGDGNAAVTVLDGTRNVSVINQWGSSQSLGQSLSGSNQGLYSQQIGIRDPSREISLGQQGGSSHIKVTIRSELK